MPMPTDTLRHSTCLSFDDGRSSTPGFVPLLGVDVAAEVVAGHARVVVRQRYVNRLPRAIEAVYTFPLPTRAIVTGFTMTVEGRRLEAEVQEKEKALETYDSAIVRGHGAALLEQERPNVFTANVGNLLPNEETIIEVEYVEPLRADEGAIRWCVPTLVAPRYVPGQPAGDRTGHGTADPTDRVPDADRISPPIGDVRYGLRLDVLFDVGADVDVESPSHAVTVRRDGARTRVTFAQTEVPLDRDVVLVAAPRSLDAPLAAVVTHRPDGTATGTFAVTVVPDLAGAESRRAVRSDVVFVLDRSGSMAGDAMREAKTALKLCLRQLVEGDRFAILAFDDSVEAFDARLVPFTQATLRRADRWIDSIDARGGTELLDPLVGAVALAPNGVVMLLTDGQVGNEAEVERAVLHHRGTNATRIHSFGIGTNVSDALLEALAEKTGGAVSAIHPGERIDEKVIGQFARATAPRVTDLRIAFQGVDVGEIAPAEPTAIVDGEPFTVFGTYDADGHGRLEIRGRLDGDAFAIDVPVELPARADRPAVAKLWAQARIKDLEKAARPESAGERRAESMRKHIVKLAIEHRVSSAFTSFVVVEKRTGDRRMNAMPEARPVPVSAPAGWAKLSKRASPIARGITMAGPSMPAPAMAPRPAAGMPAARPAMTSMRRFSPNAPAAPPPPPRAVMDRMESFDGEAPDAYHAAAPAVGRAWAEIEPPLSGPIAILASQAASGLWEGGSDLETLRLTVNALLELLRASIDADHAVYGAQVKKAAQALLEAVESVSNAPSALVELALGVAWLACSGRRTRASILAAVKRRDHQLGALAATLGDEVALRRHVDRLAPSVP